MPFDLRNVRATYQRATNHDMSTKKNGGLCWYYDSQETVAYGSYLPWIWTITVAIHSKLFNRKQRWSKRLLFELWTYIYNRIEGIQIKGRVKIKSDRNKRNSKIEKLMNITTRTKWSFELRSWNCNHSRPRVSPPSPSFFSLLASLIPRAICLFCLLISLALSPVLLTLVL